MSTAFYTKKYGVKLIVYVKIVKQMVWINS